MTKKFQIGRSMIEMLGVLAIVGVLSIGAVAMYKTAMLRYRLGQTQQWIETVRHLFAEACENKNPRACFTHAGEASYKKRADYVCALFGKALCPKNIVGSHYGNARTPLHESLLLLYMGSDHSKLGLYMSGFDKETCQAVIDYDWNGLTSITNYTNWKSATVQSGQKYLTQEQKDTLKADCPFPRYIILTFNLKD